VAIAVCDTRNPLALAWAISVQAMAARAIGTAMPGPPAGR
jgi:hypothetical protein